MPPTTRRRRALVSKVREPEPSFGGDEVIAAAESDVNCPVIEDPVRAMRVDGTSDRCRRDQPAQPTPSGASPVRCSCPSAVAFAVVFALAAMRWLITGVFKGVGAVVGTASVPREKRAAMRSRPRVTEEL